MRKLALLFVVAVGARAGVIQVSPTEIDFTALATYGTFNSGTSATVYIASSSIELDMTLRLFGCPAYDGTNFCDTDIQLVFGISGTDPSGRATLQEEYQNGQFVGGSGVPFNYVNNLQPGFYTIGFSVLNGYTGPDPGYTVLETGQLIGAVTLAPEPAAWILLGAGLIFLGCHHRLNRRCVNDVS